MAYVSRTPLPQSIFWSWLVDGVSIVRAMLKMYVLVLQMSMRERERKRMNLQYRSDIYAGKLLELILCNILFFLPMTQMLSLIGNLRYILFVI